MIKEFRNAATRKVNDGQTVNSLRGLDYELAVRRLDFLDDAASLGDLQAARSLRLHKLSGDRKGQWAIRVNGPWRIVFEWREGNAYKVEITDYHKG